MKSPKTLILTALIIVLIAIPITATKQAAAGTPQNNPIEDDILYLRRSPPGNNLTTAAPTVTTAATISVRGGSSTARTWVNNTVVPSGSTWNIPAGEYNFTFWMTATHDGISASVTFKLGYINATNQVGYFVTGTKTVTPGDTTIPVKYNITLTHPGVTLTPGTRLLLNVNISVSGPSGQSATFHYDGTGQPTQIKTPTISAVVPEFPFGVVLLPYALFLAYFVLRKRSVRLRV